VIEFRVLGRAELRDGDRGQLDSILTQPKRLAILAYLCIAGRGGFVRRDQLIALFWPESDTERARAALNQSLYVLRRTLGPDVIPRRGVEEVGVAGSQLTCDAATFLDRLDDGDPSGALDLYSGDLLPALYLDGPEADRWLDETRVDLRNRALKVAKDLGAEAAARGDVDQACERYQRALEIVPESESAARGLVESLWRGGHRTAALEASERFERRLSTEYGVEPGAEFQELVERVRRGFRVRDDGQGPANRVARAEQFATTLETEPDPVEGASPRTGAVLRLGPRAGWLSRHRGMAYAAVVVLAIGAVLGYLPQAPSPPVLAEDVITVLPFAAPGGSQDVQKLAEQLPEAFWAVLDGRYGPQVSDLGAVRDKWEAAGGSAIRLLPQASALRIAEEMGSAKLVFGTVTGTEQSLTLTATLLEVPSGEPRVFRTSVAGSADRFATLVDSLLVQLLGADFGEIGERLPGLAAHPNEAVLAYLAGEYNHAFDLDSTFLLAGMKAYAWQRGEQDHALAQFIWDHRHELGPRDRAYWEAQAGWRFGATPDVATWIAQFDSARALTPDGRIVRFDELDKLFHWGPLTELDWAARAHEVIGELTEIDSLSVRCLWYRGWLAALELDAEAYRRHWESCADYWASRPEGAEAPLIFDDPRHWNHALASRWVLAQLSGDSAATASVSAELAAADDSVQLAGRPLWWGMTMLGPRLHGRGVADVDLVAATAFVPSQVMWERWRGRRDRFQADFAEGLEFGISRGWTSQVYADAALVAAALFLDMPLDGSVRSAADRLGQVARGDIDPGIAQHRPGPGTAYLMTAGCWSTLWKLLQEGDTSGAMEAAKSLRTLPELPNRWAGCAGMIEVEAARIEGRDAGPALARLDSLMRRGPNPGAWEAGALTAGGIPNLLLARDLVQQGDTLGALAAARRRTWPGASPPIDGAMLTEFLREEGRLAALAGDVEGAIEAYYIYLALRDARTGYEPWDAERKAVQEELADLIFR